MNLIIFYQGLKITRIIFLKYKLKLLNPLENRIIADFAISQRL